MAVEFIEHTSSATIDEATLPREELKAFMTARPPSKNRRELTTSKAKPVDKDEVDDRADAANLKNDIALQRLLTESHLLDADSSLTPTGANRHKAIDLRLQTMGSRVSLLAQEKMPMSHRKGIVAKAADREDKRRREARENGIVLERVKKKVKGNGDRRQRCIGDPQVGKLTGGLLRLSKRDVADIEGPKRGAPKTRGAKRR
ncbi:MAG: hypothetical protein M1832_006257 [Thelocarpon impressellum]|nr:MAG: hypothetical protein M1832_006257 [Thelocarpon impressellum]